MANACLRLAAATLCLVALAPPLQAAAPKAESSDDKPLPYEAGEKWRVTTKVSMPGLSMPGGMGMPDQTTEVCQSKTATDGPMGADQKNCTITNRRNSGNKQSAHIRCDQDGEVMEGDLEGERLGPDHYRMNIHMKTSHGPIDMSNESQKVGGECDANEPKRKVQALNRQGAQMQQMYEGQMAQTCTEMATQMNTQMLSGQGAVCTDPKYKALLCKTAQGYDGYGRLAQQLRVSDDDPSFSYLPNHGKQMQDVAGYCGFKPEAVRSRLCETAQADGQLAFLGANCPTQADPLGAKVCLAGLAYSPEQPPDAQYAAFCKAWLETEKGQAAATEARSKAGKKKPDDKPKSDADKAKDAIEKGKAKLKSLFGR